jgi:hypothetical protein
MLLSAIHVAGIEGNDGHVTTVRLRLKMDMSKGTKMGDQAVGMGM